MSGMINHADYKPTPRDMTIALKAIADLTKEVTGKTPNILVGASKLYPPKNGQIMSKKAAVAAHEALYGEKGTIVVKDVSTPVFKQTNGSIGKDDFQLQTKLAPIVESPENKLARDEYQNLLDKHPVSANIPRREYAERLTLPPADQKNADTLVTDMAASEKIPVEEFTNILAQGSGYVNTHLNNKVGNNTQPSEGLEYLAKSTTQYRERLLSNEEALKSIEVPQIKQKTEINEADKIVFDPAMTGKEAILTGAYAEASLELEQAIERSTEPGSEYIVDEPWFEALVDRVESLEKELGLPSRAVAEVDASEPANDLYPDGYPDESEAYVPHELSEEINADLTLPIEHADANGDEIVNAWDEPMSPQSLQEAPADTVIEQSELDFQPQKIESEASEIVSDPIDLKEVSENLTSDQRFSPGNTPASAEQMIAQLTANLESLQSEMDSIRQTMDKIANKEPIPKIREWAKDRAQNVVAKMQDRAKVDTVKLVNFGKNFAQQTMDAVGKAANVYEEKMLKVDNVSTDLKTLVHDIHDGAPNKVRFGDYTVSNDKGAISVDHKDRGTVFTVDDKGAGFKGKFNSQDYNMLSNLKEVVAVIVNPAAAIAEVARDLAMDATKQEAKKASVKL
jgi:hypothetical protein